MTFKVISVENKTCQAGTLSESATSWGPGDACIDKNTSGEVSIPSEVDGYKVTRIAGAAFYGCGNITKVNIPSTVVAIGKSAFAYCYKMPSLYIPSTVLEISFNSLDGATGRNTIIVDPANPVYDSRNNCNAVVETATNLLVAGCATTVIPSTVTGIGKQAFYGCGDLTSVNIPANLTLIGGNTTFGNSSATYMNQVFDGCSSLATITVASGNKVYDSRNGCNAIIEKSSSALLFGSNSTVIPASVKIIQEHSFHSRALTSISIPEGVTVIGSSAFAYCENLTSVTIPSTVTSIENEAFNNTYSWQSSQYIKNITTKIQKPFAIADDVFTSSTYSNGILHVPDGTKGLYSVAGGWKSFVNIDGTGEGVPISTDLKDGDTFKGTTQEGIEMTFTVVSAVNKTCMVGKPSNNGTYSMDNSAINNSTQGFVTIPSVVKGFTVTGLSASAFYGCYNITGVSIPKTVTSIADFAFASCSSMKSLTIPASVTSLSNYSLADATGRVLLSVEAANPIYDSRNGCNGVIETATNTLVAGCQTTQIPSTVTSLGQAAFYGCNDLQTLIIPKSVSSIGRQALSYCRNINAVRVENGNAVYDSREGCNAIIETTTNKLVWATNSTVIPSFVKIIGDESFTYRNFRSIIIPDGVVNIESDAFRFCQQLVSVVIPKSVTTIGNDAFSGCNLIGVTCRMTNPIALNESVFSSFVYTSARLNVPVGTKALYKAKSGWSKFSNIVELTGENQQGDASGDGVVDTSDIIEITQGLIGKPSKYYDAKAADVNGDGVVNVADIVLLINKLKE